VQLKQRITAALEDDIALGDLTALISEVERAIAVISADAAQLCDKEPGLREDRDRYPSIPGQRLALLDFQHRRLRATLPKLRDRLATRRTGK
jgi:hypothetical protein